MDLYPQIQDLANMFSRNRDLNQWFSLNPQLSSLNNPSYYNHFWF